MRQNISDVLTGQKHIYTYSISIKGHKQITFFQMNGATHYTDLSHLYGNSDEKLAILRAPGGLLDIFNDYGRELPPLTERKECLNMHDGAACFESGN